MVWMNRAKSSAHCCPYLLTRVAANSVSVWRVKGGFLSGSEGNDDVREPSLDHAREDEGTEGGEGEADG